MWFERWLLWYLGGEVPQGDNTQLTWELSSRNPFAPCPGWVVVAGIFIAWAILFWYVRRRPRSDSRVTTLLCGGVAAALFLLMLFQVTLDVGVAGRPPLAILLDVSESMQFEDQLDATSRQAVQDLVEHARASSNSPEASISRLTTAKAVLSQQNGELLDELLDRYQVTLFPFADGIVESHDAATAAPLNAEWNETLEQVAPVAGTTNPRLAVQNVSDAFRGRTPAAFVILTDGIPTSSDQGKLSLAAADIARRGVPLFPVVLGSTEGVRDLRIEKVIADRTAFAGDPFQIEVRLAGDGVQGESVEVQLLDRATGERLGEQSVALRSGEGNHVDQTVYLEVTPDTAGPLDLEIRCQRLSGELSEYNNLAQARVWVRPGELRVLLVERTPRWEFRHLKGTLERDTAIRLSTWLQESDPETIREDRTALQRLPETAEEWAEYDVVLWGDVVPARAQVETELLKEVVVNQGAGLLVLPGRQLRQSFPSSLQELSPAVPQLGQWEGTAASGWKVTRTLDGRAVRFLKFDDSEQNQTLPLARSPQPVTTRAGAVVLLQAGDPSSEQPIPVLVEQHFGAGRVLYQNIDETWRWRPINEASLYRQYWSQLVRHLGKTKLDHTQPVYDLQVDRPQYAPQSPITLTLFANAEVTDPKVELRRDDAFVTQVSLSNRIQDGEFQATLRDLPPGRYTATLPEAVSLERRTASWEVADVNIERKYEPANVDDLEQAAKISGGRCYRPWETDRLSNDLPRGEALPLQRQLRIAIWTRWELLLLLVLTLSLEWYIRQ
ncbi:MAG: VWA domain-containing protein [Planctomycetaceae bacterium]|nr:VWA domain-containing protein [Planctomycetaceae bacterium]MCB9952756.1 VWA domain-containing protein [Planctomycetaceae bacterium]